jgi:hypothetical protein
MPIRRELLGFYPIDWRELSRVIQFERAKGRFERCGRPHGQTISHLGDGRWFDTDAEFWRDARLCADALVAAERRIESQGC